VEDLVEKYRRFAERECKDYSPAYYRLALEVSDDVEILAFVAQQPVTQPNLLFAAVQYLTGPAEMPLSAVELGQFLRDRGEEVATLMRTRRTQTNEVGRCATLLPALPAGPLAIVEVGASAGLCLLLDKYHYDYGFAQAGDPSSPVHIECRAHGSVPVPGTIPYITWRRGLDLNPLDLRDDEDAQWLVACVWPDHPVRRRRLEAAISVARTNPPVVVAGDLTTDLAALLVDAPKDAQLVVFHSATLFYIADEQKEGLVNVLTETSHTRDVVWISNEGCGAIPELAAIAPAGEERRGILGRTLLSRGKRVDSVLATAHPHGAELTWLGQRHD
jgi:hypothetical protein